MEYAMEVEGLSREYKDFALKQVNLRVPEGSIVGLIGENGAGKSTTIKAALGLVHRDQGNVRFFGREVKDFSQEVGENVGVVFDSLNFSQLLTAGQIGKICRRIYQNWDTSEYLGYLQKFQLPESKLIKEYSKGMKAKFSLAIAMSHHARLLILDEPTSGLDPVMRDEILDIFLDFVQDARCSILVSSHITSDLEKIADYIVFLHQGEVILQASKDELLYSYGVIRCGRGELDQIDPRDRIACKMMDYQCNVLVRDRRMAQRKYGNMIVDPVSIDEIMLFYVKGEQR